MDRKEITSPVKIAVIEGVSKKDKVYNMIELEFGNQYVCRLFLTPEQAYIIKENN